MFLFLIFIPFFTFVLIFFFGRYFGVKGSCILAVGSIFSSFFLSSASFYYVCILQNNFTVNVINWISVGIFRANWGFIFDSVSVVMLVVVTFISLLVHIYSLEYMKNDPQLSKFMSYLLFFTFFMLILVTADNFVQMFLGWEGVGLSSYLLINFWHTRVQANKAAIKAMIVNRIGDFGLSLGIFAIFYVFKTVELPIIFSSASGFADDTINFCGWNVSSLNFIAFCFFIGAVGKSAQLGLHVWLPDAMEGPTPVSALIHAATMVTAGVFIVIRSSSIFEYASFVLFVMVLIGGFTAFFAATVALFQNDIKRVIAYSTCSQLGYMIFICGVSGYSFSFFHLVNHAFFKALLFLGAGSIIHALSDEQDMRRMGGFAGLLPFSYIVMVVGSFSLMGFPFMSGFYSKDLILEIGFSNFSISGMVIYWFAVLSAFFTAFYSFRLIYLTFFCKINFFLPSLRFVQESNQFVFFPLVLLSIGSIFSGFMLKDMFVGIGSPFWGNAIFVHPSHSFFVTSEFIPTLVKLVPVIFSLCGAFFSFLFYFFFKDFEFNSSRCNFFFINFYQFFSKKWYFDFIYNYFFVSGVLKFGYIITFKLLDRGFIEYFGPFGLTNLVQNISCSFSKVQSGFIYHYICLMFLGVVSFLFLFYFNFDFEFFFVYVYLILFIFSYNKTKSEIFKKEDDKKKYS